MIGLLVVSIIIGAAISGATGIGVLFWIAGGFVFLCGLPGALLASFVHGEVSYTQDCEDYRQTMSEIKAEELADEHEFAEDARFDRLVESLKTRANTYNDNRQVHFHGRPEQEEGVY